MDEFEKALNQELRKHAPLEFKKSDDRFCSPDYEKYMIGRRMANWAYEYRQKEIDVDMEIIDYYFSE